MQERKPQHKAYPQFVFNNKPPIKMMKSNINNEKHAQNLKISLHSHQRINTQN